MNSILKLNQWNKLNQTNSAVRYSFTEKWKTYNKKHVSDGRRRYVNQYWNTKHHYGLVTSAIGNQLDLPPKYTSDSAELSLGGTWKRFISRNENTSV